MASQTSRVLLAYVILCINKASLVLYMAGIHNIHNMYARVRTRATYRSVLCYRVHLCDCINLLFLSTIEVESQSVEFMSVIEAWHTYAQTVHILTIFLLRAIYSYWGCGESCLLLTQNIRG